MNEITVDNLDVINYYVSNIPVVIFPLWTEYKRQHRRSDSGEEMKWNNILWNEEKKKNRIETSEQHTVRSTSVSL